MAQAKGSKRPFETLYTDRRNPVAYEQAMGYGRSASYMGAITNAVRKLKERGFHRADIYNEWGTHLYAVVRVGGSITINRIRGERL